MSTVNISLPNDQISTIDVLIKQYGFANRSEFFRSLLRLVKNKPELIDKAATFPFVAPAEKSTAKIIKAFGKTRKYSPEFLKDLKEGLENSDYFRT